MVIPWPLEKLLLPLNHLTLVFAEFVQARQVRHPPFRILPLTAVVCHLMISHQRLQSTMPLVHSLKCQVLL